jgi:hypothetical protein
VVRNVYDKEARRSILTWLKAGEFAKVFTRIEELKYECGGLEDEVKKLTVLERYINSNIDGIVIYKNRDGIHLPTPPEGIEYRNLGTMERNIGVFSDRMKRGKSWSKDGATNLSKIIALKMVSGFKDKIASLISGKLPERFTERFKEVISSSKISLSRDIKKCIYPMHRGSIPFTSYKVTEFGEEVRKIFNLKTFSELMYR